MKDIDDLPDVRAVLDCSGLRSYALEHVHVGELLIDIADEEGHIAIPAASLAEATAKFDGDEHRRALLRLLTTLPGTTVLKLDADAAFAMAGTMERTGGDISHAHAVWAAHKYKALYLTTEPHRSSHILPSGQIHPIPAEDA